LESLQLKTFFRENNVFGEVSSLNVFASSVPLYNDAFFWLIKEKVPKI
jgi:hypothetical protein